MSPDSKFDWETLQEMDDLYRKVIDSIKDYFRCERRNGKDFCDVESYQEQARIFKDRIDLELKYVKEDLNYLEKWC